MLVHHATDVVLSVADVRKSYGTTPALRGVSLDISAGEIVGLLGPNGAGKTTLISVVAGLVRPDAGSVRVAGVDALRHRERLRGLLGLAPQELGICPETTVSENLTFFGQLSGMHGGPLRMRIDEVSEALGLTPLLRRPARALSVGQQRRLHTAAALLHRPPLLLLDEPTVGADVHARIAILDVVRRLAEERSAICYSTHYLPEVEELEASIAVLEHGTIIVKAPVRELVSAQRGCTIEMTFDGPPPTVDVEDDVTALGSTLRITTQREPGAAIATVLAQLTDAARLRGVEILRPSLESVYLGLTGHRYDARGAGTVEAGDAGR